MTIRFDEALERVLLLVSSNPDGVLAGVGKLVVVRDLRGRLRLALERPPRDQKAVERLLHESAGAFAADGLLIGTEMLLPDAVFNSPDVHHQGGVAVLERVAMGAEWTRRPLRNIEPTPPRATLYGIKGGVGRSTVLVAWARHLAQRGEHVLVVDLDLESPGVSTTLMPAGAGPEFGVVDWFVEDAVGNVDEDFIRQMVGRSPLASSPGDILVATCGGERGKYLSKLSRAYLDIPEQDGPVRTFGDRLAAMIDALELTHNPTVVLIDSRAGVHDLAGIATTRLGAMTFMFAVGSRQTWSGYRTLLKEWASQPVIAREIRERLRIVAAQVPETGRDAYLNQLRTDSYDMFAETLYEEVGPNNLNGFNFDVNATDAPHFPLPVYWSRPFQEWDPLTETVTVDQVRSAFGEFLDSATDLLLDPEPSDGEI